MTSTSSSTRSAARPCSGPGARSGPGGRLGTVAASGEGASDPRTRAAFFIVQANREQLGASARLIDQGRLRPVVDAVLPLAQAREAYEHRATRGKVVPAVTG